MSRSVAQPADVRRDAGAAPLARARSLLASVPTAAWHCALVATLHAVAWSLLTPPLTVPDEGFHYAYVEHVAQTGRPPADAAGRLLSPEQAGVEAALELEKTTRRPYNAGVWSATERARLLDALADRRSGGGNGWSYGAAPQPPLYYALQAIPYRLASGGDLLQRLALMRLVSALLAGVAVALTFLFLREALPGAPWAWTIGALGVALHPLFGFIGGGLNPDAVLCVAAAGLFLCMARMLRRGLSPRLAIATGLVLGVGAVGKLNLLGLVPAVVAALLLAAYRDGDGGGAPGRALRLPLLALAIASVPLACVALLNVTAWDRAAIGLVSTGTAGLGGASLLDRLEYAWQLYLPPLPGMHDVFGYSTTRWLWWRGYVGWFGLVDTPFPERVYALALVPFGLVLALAGRTLVVARGALRRRRAEAAVYALAVAGMLTLIAAQSWSVDAAFGLNGSGGQTRYLFPLLPLCAALLALAARGAGTRWQRPVAVLLVALFLVHAVASQLLVVGRFHA